MHVQMREEELLRLEAFTRDVCIPLLIARSYGLMGYVRVRWLLRAHSMCQVIATLSLRAGSAARAIATPDSLVAAVPAAPESIWCFTAD
jgi:alanine-alpha-ketoisovalerate/valine-pyruvate aminotransferase